MTKTELKRIQNALKHQYEVSLKFNGNIVVIGTYINNNAPIEYYCITHDVFFFVRPTAIIYNNRKGCSICSGLTNWTTDSVIKRIQYLNQDEFGNNTLLIDEFEYEKLTQDIWLTCLIDGHRWRTSIGNLIHNTTSCKQCTIRNRKISFDELHRRNNEINTDEFGVLRVIIRCTREWYDEHYTTATDTKILVGCSNSDHPDWEVSITCLLNAESGCIECYNIIRSQHLKLTIEDFFNKIPTIFLNEHGNPLHKFDLRNFNGYNSIIRIFDPNHGWFTKKVSNYLKGYGHPNTPKCKSRGELAVQEFLIENNIKFMREYTIAELIRLRFDFFLPKYNCFVEFDGPQHYIYDEWIWKGRYDKFLKQQENDKIKDQWCLDNGIKMIRITKIKDIPTQLNFLINNINK